jgi:predicted outer membrane repeat protein
MAFRLTLARIALATVLCAALRPVPAAQAARPTADDAVQAASWRDGAPVYSNIVNCVSIIQGSPYNESGMGVYVSQLMDPDVGQPTANQVYYLRVVLAGLGTTCSGMYAALAFELPANTSMAVSVSNPIYCVFNNTVSACPVQSFVGSGLHPGAQLLPSGDPNIANMWPVPTGKFLEVRIPVVSSAALSNSTFRVYADVADGNSNPNLAPTLGVYVFGPGTPSFAFDTPSTISVTQNSGYSRGYLYTNGASGNVFWDWGTSPALGSSLSLGAAGPGAFLVFNDWLDNANQGTLSPSTTYYWRLRYVVGGNTHTSVVNSFTTLSNGEEVVGNGSAASCTDSAVRATLNNTQTRSIRFECGIAPITITLDTAGGSDQLGIIARNVLIDGGSRVTLKAGPTSPHFIIGPGASLDLRNIQLIGARTPGCGGAVFANGTFTATNVRFIDNNASNTGGAICAFANVPVLVQESTFISNSAGPGGFGGGAIWVENSQLTVRNSDFTSNTTAGNVAMGGAIALQGNTFTWGSAYIEDSTFTGNRAPNGGAIMAVNGRLVRVATSTFSGNSATGFGGAIFGVTHLSNVSVVSNTASGACYVDEFERLCVYEGGGLHGQSRITNTLLSGNSPNNCFADEDPNGYVSAVSGGNNLSSEGSCLLTGSGDLQSVPAGIAPLALNGGRTRTHALNAGSAALNAGNSSACTAYGCLDQRGSAANGTIDIGAYERTVNDTYTPTPTPPGVGSATSPATGSTATPTATQTPAPTATPTQTATPTGGMRKVALPSVTR